MVKLNSDIKELIFVSVKIISALNTLAEIETGENVDYSDVRTDLKWSLMVLNNRINDLK